MYASFYQLKHCPFVAGPDANLCVSTPAYMDALTRLERCVRQARGIGIVTGVAGIGKTHLLQRLGLQLREEFGVIHVPNASFPSPRGLLQCLLAEFGESYERMSETELRLRLTAAAHDARATTNGMVLLLDEAHRFNDRLLEEVRLISNFVFKGEPLFRIVLAGQISLEDRLSESNQTGLNERIGEWVNLPRLTAEESRHFLEARIEFAGGKLETLIEPAAVDVIVKACGGIPRCLNQLGDHALLLGHVAERRSVSESLVREALDDLKRLPLQWLDPLPTRSTITETPSFPPTPSAASLPAESDDDIIEIGSLDDFSSESCANTPAESDDAQQLHPSDEPWENVLEPHLQARDDRFSPAEPPEVVNPPAKVPPLEYVSDRFARLDAEEAEKRWLDSWRDAQEKAKGPPPIPTSMPEAAAPNSPTPAAAPSVPRKAEPPLLSPQPEAPPHESSSFEASSGPAAQSAEESMNDAWKSRPKSATLFRDLRWRQGLP